MGIKEGDGVMGNWIFAVLTVSLGMTVVLEEGFGWMVGVRNRWDMALIALVNLLTNPVVVLIYHLNGIYGGMNPACTAVLLEMGAIAAEGMCYRAAAGGIRHPWLFSAGANLFSYTAGLVIERLV